MVISLERQKKDSKRVKLFSNYPPIDVKHFLSRRISILGTSGSGKSFTNGVLMEEFRRVGVVQFIIDTEGDYTGLKSWDTSSYVVFGKRKSKDSKEIPEESIQKAVSYVMGETEYGEFVQTKNVILLLNDWNKKERLNIIYKALTILWERIRLARPKRSIAILVDEAHEKCPQARPEHLDLRILLEDIAKLGRKQGVTLVVSSQRPAEVSKNVLAQCDIFIMHRVNLPHDIDTYANYLNLSFEYTENYRAIAATVPKFQNGECYYKYQTSDPEDTGIKRVQVRMRTSKHTSVTPGREALVTY